MLLCPESSWLQVCLVCCLCFASYVFGIVLVHNQDTGIANWSFNFQAMSGSKGKQKQVDKTCTWLLSICFEFFQKLIFAYYVMYSFGGGKLICMNVSLIFRLIIFKGKIWVFSYHHFLQFCHYSFEPLMSAVFWDCFNRYKFCGQLSCTV